MKKTFSGRTRLAIGVAAIAVTTGLGVSQLMAQSSQPIEVTADTFDCLTEMTAVRGFFVDNLLGDLDATVAAANAAEGAPYPVGSVVQLVPTEVMLKQPEGTSPATNDWEFFELNVSPEGSEIAVRGFTDVVNRFGGNCLDCHIKAEPQWDMVCETGHGCDPLPLSREMLTGIQQADPRCRAPEV
ncbi:hypothetical protein PHACT_06245 [Pseudohongiella acticola]|uniref:Cytochrome P460 domain-containing protein n=1 Tax=Pseudohongiella acticola TaxID=1524254 RepID=A0A1E8CKI4_9GAMM|nr:hypothetical protein [Pseudohongiella acticola]OFE12787.1 hypothetical protein PHACT_06245 [Pseudohongiella acticola]